MTITYMCNFLNILPKMVRFGQPPDIDPQLPTSIHSPHQSIPHIDPFPTSIHSAHRSTLRISRSFLSRRRPLNTAF